MLRLSYLKALTETGRGRMQLQRAGEGVIPVRALLYGNTPEPRTQSVEQVGEPQTLR